MAKGVKLDFCIHVIKNVIVKILKQKERIKATITLKVNSVDPDLKRSMPNKIPGIDIAGIDISRAYLVASFLS